MRRLQMGSAPGKRENNHSEFQFERKLSDSWVPGTSDLPKRCTAQIGVGIVGIDVIEHIEELSSEL